MKTFFTLLLCVVVLAHTPDTVSAADSGAVVFNRDVRPILSDHCFACHGFDPKKREADLRLDVPEGARQDLGGRFPIVPGKLDQSEVWRRVVSDNPDEVMPPPHFRKALNSEQKSVIKRWI